MRLRFAAVLATAAFTLARPAFAEGQLSATLQSDTGSSKFIASHVLWTCADAVCTASNATQDALGLTGCEELVKRVGPVKAYTGAKPLDDSKLAKCNLAAKPTDAQLSKR